MDPNEALRRIRRFVTNIATDVGYDDDDVTELAELVDGLDEWLVGGGFLPAAWGRK